MGCGTSINNGVIGLIPLSLSPPKIEIEYLMHSWFNSCVKISNQVSYSLRVVESPPKPPTLFKSAVFDQSEALVAGLDIHDRALFFSIFSQLAVSKYAVF